MVAIIYFEKAVIWLVILLSPRVCNPRKLRQGFVIP